MLMRFVPPFLAGLFVAIALGVAVSAGLSLTPPGELEGFTVGLGWFELIRVGAEGNSTVVNLGPAAVPVAVGIGVLNAIASNYLSREVRDA